MRRSMVVFVALVCFSLPCFANGGGGVEYFTNAGSDLIGKGFFGGSMVDFPTGSVSALSAYGFAVTRRGWKIGGFATGLFAQDLSLAIPEAGMSVDRAAGGFGGIISGGAGRWGPVGFAINTRLGAGGLAVEGSWTGGSEPSPMIAGVFSLFASVEAEVGIIVVPAMLVSVYCGLDAVAPLSPYFFAVLAAPTFGARITWGRF
jgi:hypothetical protein